MEKLKTKILQGFKWTGIYTLSNALLNATMILVMGLYFSAEELGVKAILTLVVTLSVMLTQFGIAQAIIQSEETTSHQLSSLFWFNVTLGFLLGGVVFISAPLISVFFENPQLSDYIKLSSGIFIIESMSLVQKAILEKKLKFRVSSILSILKLIFITLITILLTIFEVGPVSYIIGNLSGAILLLVFINIYFYKNEEWALSLRFKYSDIKIFLSFGFYVTAKNFVNFGSKNLDEVLIGKLLGFELLGIYHLAKQVIDKFLELATYSFSKVNFPIFSEIVNKKKDYKLFREYYLKMTYYVACIGFPIIFILIAVLPSALNIFTEEAKWIMSINIMVIFLIKGFFDLLSGGFSSSALYAFGKPSTLLKVDIWLLPIRVSTLILGSFWSIEGVAISYLCFVILKVIILQRLVNKLSKIRWKQYLKMVTPHFVVSVLIYAASSIVLAYLTDLLSLTIYILSFAGIYILVSVKVIKFESIY